MSRAKSGRSHSFVVDHRTDDGLPNGRKISTTGEGAPTVRRRPSYRALAQPGGAHNPVDANPVLLVGFVVAGA